MNSMGVMGQLFGAGIDLGWLWLGMVETYRTIHMNPPIHNFIQYTVIYMTLGRQEPRKLHIHDQN